MSILRKSAEGRECQIRIPGYCCYENEKVVLCHQNGAGIAIKNPDYQGAYGCWKCHAVVDGRLSSSWTDNQILVWFYQGVFRTQEIIRKEGLIKVVDKRSKKD